MADPGYDVDRVVAQLGDGDVRWLDGDDTGHARGLPPIWIQIASSPSPANRTAMAMSQWPPAVLVRLPRFGRLLAEQLIDVVPATIGEQDFLVYVTRDGDDVLPWTGTRPYNAELPLRAGPPPELSAFQMGTHAGFGLEAGDLHGVLRPEYQISRTEFFGVDSDEGHRDEYVAGEYHGRPVHWDDLFLLSYDNSQAFYFSSPLFAPGDVAFMYYNDFEIQDVWSSLDDFMVTPYVNVVY